MSNHAIADERIKQLNDLESRDGDFTLYWMQQSQRAEFNHALEFAIQRANEQSQRLLVAFVLTDDYPDANLRHYQFMLQGLLEVSRQLKQRNIRFCLRLGDPPQVIKKLAKDASEVICDRGYLRHQVRWRSDVAEAVECRVWQVESDVIVPVEKASDKREWAARTIRSKLNEAADDYLVDLPAITLKKNSLNLGIDGIEFRSVQSVLDQLSIDTSVGGVDEWAGGTSQAKSRLEDFMSNQLGRYDEGPNVIDPHVSHLSPYLHFGQMSPVQMALRINSKRGHTRDVKDAYLEQLLVRRELAFNFVHYESDYDSLTSVPSWAQETMSEHEDDSREHHYTATELENAETHDESWNAAMTEMKHRGYLHNHLRMYWGKKIIEWTNTYQHAYRTALDLNNKYFLDGRDPNSYTNVLWLFGLHDRAHQERPIFGKLRYMSADGLRRKLDVDEYVKSVRDRYSDA